MLLIPAIDLKDGRCVRLKQGDMSESTTFGEDPAAMARRWVDAGARRLHLVDLNGAFAGKPVNEGAIKAILAEVGDEIPVQLGGGIRDLDTIERYLDDGLSFIIIGTAAVKNPGFLHFVKTSGLPFKAHEQFMAVDVTERGDLYRAIAKQVWNPDNLLAVAEGDA